MLPLQSALAEAPSVAQKRGALFKVQDASHTLYLFGTIHVGAPDFYPLEPTVTQALNGAGALALEIDPGADPRKAVSAVLKYGMEAPGSKVPPDCRQTLAPRLAPLLQKYGIAPAAVAPMKPWMLASVLAIGEFSTLGYRSDLAVDSYLSQQAKARKIPVVELESMEGQMALFGAMSPLDQCRFLEDGVASIEEQEQSQEAREIADAWRNADAAAFDKLAAKAATDPSFAAQFVQKVLLDGRNPALADGIANLLAREKSSLAAIGVLHLVGDKSVPDLLRKRGLKVERVY
ncbi:TraB/GumN family protein [Janthinobacterium sp. GMG2]|uniref:TraB/GumN family protein n=1 Tax=Janthinobacterium sp. GMG2 TaxID=3096606 RepID=UPI0029F4BE5B|nr:TraB/GumN family protein [Janthinobacterium sp. GMG2]MDX8122704.1 TraB/GumN family protein [Janthinobacterium sp. GMG2]